MQEDIALEEIGAERGAVIGAARAGIGGAEEQAAVGVASVVDDVALDGVVGEVDIVEAAHEHLAVATGGLQLAVDNLPFALAIAPFRTEAFVEVVGHLMGIDHAALDVVLHDVDGAVDDLHGEAMVTLRHDDILDGLHAGGARGGQFDGIVKGLAVEEQAQVDDRRGGC